MLPLRVRLQQLLGNPSFVRQVIGACLALVLLAMIVAGNISIDIHIGEGRDGADVVAAQPTTSLSGSADSVDATSLTPGQLPSSLLPATDDGAQEGVAAAPTIDSAASAPAKQSASGVKQSSAGGTGTAPTSAPASGSTPAAATQTTVDPCAGELTAVDNGVDEDSITVALLTVNLAALDAAGFGLSTGEIDNEKILGAWANHINGNGGVACRDVEFIVHETDLDVDKQVADCKTLTQELKVHAVLSPGGLVAGAQCITKDNDTPLITALAAPDYWDEEGQPFLWDVLMSQDRIMRNHARWLVESGVVDPATNHVGVVYAAEPYGGPSVESAMIPEFERLGVTLTVGRLPYEAEQAAAQMAQVVVQFQQAGVDHVVLPVNIIYKTQFMQQAEQQLYFPQYSDDEATVGCQDALTGTYPERSWDGALCVSTGLLSGAPNGLTTEAYREYLKTDAFAQKADAIYLATNPEGYDQNGEADEEDELTQQGANHLYGSLIELWMQGARRVGPNLTRAAWGAAMADTGVFSSTVSPNDYTFFPGKWSGPDHIQIVEWHAEASDGYEERLWRKKTDFFPAYY